MGFKERLSKLKESVSTSPVDVTLTEQGTTATLHAGQPATIHALVKGDNDGSVDRIELFLHLSPAWEQFPLGEIPIVAGVQSVDVQIPTGLPPSVAGHADYTVRAKVHRNKGLGSEGTLPIDVVARPEDLHWPAGPRTGQDGDAATVRIEVLLDRDVADVTAPLTGTARLVPSADVKAADATLELVATIVSPRDQNGKVEQAAQLTLSPKLALQAGQPVDLPFKIAVPDAATPTFAHGDTSIVWRAQLRHGKATGWTTFGVLDPKADAGIRARKQPGLSALMTGSPNQG